MHPSFGKISIFGGFWSAKKRRTVPKPSKQEAPTKLGFACGSFPAAAAPHAAGPIYLMDPD